MTMQNEQGVAEEVWKRAAGVANDLHPFVEPSTRTIYVIARAILADRASRTADMETCRRETLEEAAKIADKHGDVVSNEPVGKACSRNIAAAIRALASKEEGR